MALFEYRGDGLVNIERTTFAEHEILERQDLQRVLRDSIAAIAPDCMVIDEEFGAWSTGQRRIDLLCIDRSANLVVVELKRGDKGGHMELQALRYAAMVATMTFEQAVTAHRDYLRKRGRSQDAEEALLKFLGWQDADSGDFAPDVRIILVAADFSKELTTAVLWLQSRDVDLRCVRLRPHELDGKVLLDVQQVLPIPEAEEYTVRVRQKEAIDRRVRDINRDYTKFDVTVAGELYERQSKRHAILLVVRELCAQGVSPEQIETVIPWRGVDQLWFSLEGALGSEVFCDRAVAAAAEGGRAFDPRRWFCSDGELIGSSGRTLAFSTQWGRRTEEAIELLLERFSGRGITCVVSER